jgi:hypothetical protein
MKRGWMKATARAECVMAINLLIVVAQPCCNRRAVEKRKAADREPAAVHSDPQGNKADDKRRYVMNATGIPSPKYLIPYMTDKSLDMGSHNWIYKIADDGEMVPYLLFLKTGSGRTLSYEAFLLTQSDGTEKRTRLSPAEVEQRFRDIESELAKHGVKDRYDYYYAGGVPDEPEASETSADPFAVAVEAKPPRDLDSDEALREMSEQLNQLILSRTADMVRAYREVAKSQGAQPANGRE